MQKTYPCVLGEINTANLLNEVQDVLVALQYAGLEDVAEHILEDGVQPQSTILPHKGK